MKRTNTVPWFTVYLKSALGFQASAFDKVNNSAKPYSVLRLSYLLVLIIPTFDGEGFILLERKFLCENDQNAI